MSILGIDPSLTSTGLALIDHGQVTELHRVRSVNKGHERIQNILDAIRFLADPGVTVGIEGTAYAAKGSSVVQIFGLWGVITHQLYQWGIPYYVVPPSARCKYATGRGNASKDEVLAAVVRRYSDIEVTSNDVADALVVAAMGARYTGTPIEQTALPQTHIKALEGVQWTP